MIPLREADGAVSFAVKVRPRARRDELAGALGDALVVRLTAPPIEGAANDALRRLLAKALGVSPGAVELLAGQTGRAKIVRVRGVSAEAVRRLVEGVT